MGKDADRKPGFRGDTSLDQARDTGMAVVLCCLVLGAIYENNRFSHAAMALLALNMAWPAAYKPAARVWFSASHFMGRITSRIILTIIFFLIVTPIGLLRRSLGHDVLQLKKWKKGTASVFRVRNYLATAKDIETPY